MDFELVIEREASGSLAAASRREPGGRATPGPPTAEQRGIRRTLQALKQSVWLPVALRIAGISLGMLGLAGIGAASILAAPAGMKIDAAAAVAAQPATAWLAAGSGSERTAHESHGGGATCTSGHLCGGDAGAPSAGVTRDGKVILNTASIDDFTRLPGVGRRRAEAIVALRERLKRFRRPTDLLRVRGIGPKSLKRMLPHLLVDPPADSADAG